jgi:hypothetical protein
MRRLSDPADWWMRKWSDGSGRLKSSEVALNARSIAPFDFTLNDRPINYHDREHGQLGFTLSLSLGEKCSFAFT